MAKKASAPDTNATPPTGADNTATAEKPDAPKKVGRPKGFSTKDGDIFKAVDPQPTERVAPQALAIANLVVAAGKNGTTRKQLIEDMEGVVQTRQPQGRILSYYQKLLTEKGFVTITDAPAETAAKPAETEAPAEKAKA